MTWHDQIEARTNAAKIITSTKHRQQETVSDEKRKRWLILVTVWWLKSRNGLKRLVNKLQNVMFSNTRMNCMYSNSAARARGARVQSPKREEILRWNTVTRHLLSNIFIRFFKGMWQCDTCNKHLPKFVMRIIYKSAVVNKKTVYSKKYMPDSRNIILLTY